MFIIAASTLSCALLYWIEQGIGVSYLLKTAFKLLLLISVPIIYERFVKKEKAEILNFKNWRHTSVWPGLIFGVVFALVLLLAYFLVGPQIELPRIAVELENKLKINPANFLFVGLYITLGNSFIEEFFFRGFIFLTLLESGRPKTAYLLSSCLFAIYHVAIFRNWFSPPIFLLALFGLIVVGLLFSWMDARHHNFVNSWIAHALADSVIIIIGMHMFGMI
ncbi:MAG: type II CAAX endopeptidase family protein [bacterium]|nr:CPBP family intramembrane metalloprotease [Bacillota bacterium]